MYCTLSKKVSQSGAITQKTLRLLKANALIAREGLTFWYGAWTSNHFLLCLVWRDACPKNQVFSSYLDLTCLLEPRNKENPVILDKVIDIGGVAGPLTLILQGN